jgi:hypothetical protein
LRLRVASLLTFLLSSSSICCGLNVC